MKKMINGMLTASLFMVAGLAGCTKETGTKSQAPEIGDPTSMEMKIQFVASKTSEAATRTTGDTNATEDESAVKTVDVFIYDPNGTFLSTKHMAASEFTQKSPGGSNYDIYEGSTKIPTTTGTRHIYVGVNLPQPVVAAINGNNESDFKNVSKVLKDTPASIKAADGLPMFSVAPTVVTIVQDETQNKAEVKCQRLVAKVTVEKVAALKQDGAPGTLGALTWAVNNVNNIFFPMQNDSPTFKDPNWDAASYKATDFYTAVDADYKPVEDPHSDNKLYTGQYVLENTSDKKLQKELTRVTVKATFIPAQWVTSYTKGSGTVTKVANSNTTPTDFYSVAGAVGTETYYFQNSADADNYAADKASTKKTYTGGVCYWTFFINQAHNNEVYRNDFYKNSIQRIVTPGAETADLGTKGNDPAATNTTMLVTTDILNWNTPTMEQKELTQ